jgi:hypothetical protein
MWFLPLIMLAGVPLILGALIRGAAEGREEDIERMRREDMEMDDEWEDAEEDE